MADEETMDRGDVYIEPLEIDGCENCADAEPPAETVATRTVRLDFRALGMTTTLGKYCAPCAEEVADRLKASLPEEQPE